MSKVGSPLPAATGSRAKATEHVQVLDHQYTTPIHRLLDRLDLVRETGPGRWIARCPAHDDKHPSLGLRETADGTVLVKCWTGCGAADVVQAVGLELRDLFPPRPDNRPPLRRHERWTPIDVLRCLAHECMVVLIAAEAAARREVLAENDLNRLSVAAGRIRAAVEEVSNG